MNKHKHSIYISDERIMFCSLVDPNSWFNPANRWHHRFRSSLDLDGTIKYRSVSAVGIRGFESRSGWKILFYCVWSLNLFFGHSLITAALSNYNWKAVH